MEAAVLVGGDDSELDVDGLAVEHGVDLLINLAHQLLVQIPEVHHEQRTDDGGGGGERLLQDFCKYRIHSLLLSGRGGLLLGKTLLTGILGSAQSAHELRVGLQIDDFELQHVLDGLL